MSTNYPTALDSFTNPTPTDYLDSPSHAGQHSNANDALGALQAKVGINASTSSADQFLKGTGSGESDWTDITEIMSALNPVGTIREFQVSTNPGTLLGFGTWSLHGVGKTTVCIDAGDTDFGTVDETRGAKTHTLTESELASHGHIQRAYFEGTGTRSFGSTTGGTGGYKTLASASLGVSSDDPRDTEATGGDTAHNNIQPSIVSYRWVRTA